VELRNPEEWRIGCVSFSNSKPYRAAFPQGVTEAPPSELARALKAGEVDVSLVPVYAALQEGWRVLGGYGIACRGRVGSVILERKLPWDEIRRVALDQTSMTSVRLIQVLYDKVWQREVSWVGETDEAEAQVWIGDRALERIRCVDPALVEDLGEVWFRWTGLPFVFAVWAVHRDLVVTRDAAERFRSWCREGVARKEELAVSEAEKVYLSERIQFEIGSEEKKAVERFRRELEEIGLIEGGAELLEWIE
jgi:chorismate dehydratase